MSCVAHIVSSLEVGGAERLVVDLACAQQRAGASVRIVDLGHRAGPLARAARELGVRVVRVGRARSRAVRTVVLAAMFAGRSETLHLHNPRTLRALLPILPAVRGRVIYTRHGANPYDSKVWRVIHRLARPFVDGVTFVTDEARASFEAAHGRCADRHLVIANGVIVDPHVPLRSAPARLRIGSVGRLVELKGQQLVLDAIASLAPSDQARVEVHFFGDGPERERLADCARRLIADVPVVLHGTVIDRERIYTSIDVLAVGSRMEGQSLAIMEAMARGVPAVATNVGGNPALVRDGETGILVASGDAAAMADAIARMLADPDLVLRLGRAGHSLISTHHSIEAVAATYRAIYAT